MKASKVTNNEPVRTMAALISKRGGGVWLPNETGNLVYFRPSDGKIESNHTKGNTLEEKYHNSPDNYDIVYVGDKIEIQF